MALTLLAALLGASDRGLAQAQDPAEGPEGPEGGFEAPIPVVPPPPEGIESIEITGEREVTSVQDEATAISRFDMGDLDKLNITNVDGLASNVPGLHVGQQGQAAIITLRGVGTENASLTGESGVAFHVDGIYYGRPTAARVAFFDLDMLDVKRGPQGLLGGKNTTSGSIMVNTRDPQMGEYGVDADFLLGNYDRQRARGALNIPLGEIFAARIALFLEGRDGYLQAYQATPDPSFNNRPRIPVDAGKSKYPFDADNFGLRGKLRFLPSDSLDLVLGYHWFKEDGNGPQADIVPLEAQRGITALSLDGTPQRGNPCVNKNRDALGNTTLDASNYWRSYGPFAYVPDEFRSQMPFFVACNFDRFIKPPDRVARNHHYPGIEDLDPRKIYVDDIDLISQSNRYWGFSNKLDWDVPRLPGLGETHLKLLGGYQRTENEFDQDFDASSLLLFPLGTSGRVHEYSSQLEWSGTLAERLDGQTSLFFAHEKGESQTLNTTFGAEADPNNPNAGSAAAAAVLETNQEVDNKSYGAALHGAYNLTDSVTFSLGGRWIKDRKESFLSRQVGANWEACVPKGNNEPWGREVQPDGSQRDPTLPLCEETFRGQMWGSRIEFRPSDDHTLYAGIDRGYKSGGFGLGGVGGYLPERIWAYSLGTKSTFFDQRLQVNLEGFVYNYQDMQIALIDGTEVRTENSDARMYGWEVEMRASPLEGLNLSAIVNYIHTETIDYYSLDPATLGDRFEEARLIERDKAEEEGERFVDRTCAGRPCGLIGTSGNLDGLDDYSGRQLSRSPEMKTTFSGEYEIPLGRLGSLTPHVKYTWQDDTYFRVFNRDFDLQDDFHKTDAKLIWESPEQRWTAEVFVENIEDAAIKDFILIGSRLFSAPPLAWYSPPRFYGARVGFKY
jgi:iron complex outermembrane receptor protein